MKSITEEEWLVNTGPVIPEVYCRRGGEGSRITICKVENYDRPRFGTGESALDVAYNIVSAHNETMGRV